MEERLGTALLRAGHIDQHALDEALEVQVTTGGRLGSLLVTLGHLREEDLARLLADHYGLPVVDRATLHKTDPLLFGDFSRDFAAYHQVLCLSVKGRTVELAMVDPGDVTAREVVEQRTLRRISLRVLPEALFWEYAGKHYDLSMPERPAWKPVRRPPRESSESPSPPAPPPPTPAPEAPKVETAPVGKPARVPSWAKIALDDRTDAELLATVVTTDAREELGHTLEIWGRKNGSSFATLVLRRQEATGWVALAKGVQAPRVEGLSFDLGRPSVFRDVVQQRAGYQGVPPNGAVESEFFAALGVPLPREMILLPVQVQGRVVNLLYLDGGAEGPIAPGALSGLEQLAEALSATYLRLILSRRAQGQRDRMSAGPDGEVGG